SPKVDGLDLQGVRLCRRESMAINQQQVQQFFAEYEARTNRALGDPPQVDADAAVGAFAECFIEASPTGVICAQNDDQFRGMVEQGYDFYRSIGTQWMRIRSLDVTLLDDFHAMAKIHWEALYKKQDGSEDTV